MLSSPHYPDFKITMAPFPLAYPSRILLVCSLLSTLPANTNADPKIFTAHVEKMTLLRVHSSCPNSGFSDSFDAIRRRDHSFIIRLAQLVGETEIWGVEVGGRSMRDGGNTRVCVDCDANGIYEFPRAQCPMYSSSRANRTKMNTNACPRRAAAARKGGDPTFLYALKHTSTLSLINGRLLSL